MAKIFLNKTEAIADLSGRPFVCLSP